MRYLVRHLVATIFLLVAVTMPTQACDSGIYVGRSSDSGYFLYVFNPQETTLDGVGTIPGANNLVGLGYDNESNSLYSVRRQYYVETNDYGFSLVKISCSDASAESGPSLVDETGRTSFDFIPLSKLTSNPAGGLFTIMFLPRPGSTDLMSALATVDVNTGQLEVVRVFDDPGLSSVLSLTYDRDADQLLILAKLDSGTHRFFLMDLGTFSMVPGPAQSVVDYQNFAWDPDSTYFLGSRRYSYRTSYTYIDPSSENYIVQDLGYILGNGTLGSWGIEGVPSTSGLDASPLGIEGALISVPELSALPEPSMLYSDLPNFVTEHTTSFGDPEVQSYVTTSIGNLDGVVGGDSRGSKLKWFAANISLPATQFFSDVYGDLSAGYSALYAGAVGGVNAGIRDGLMSIGVRRIPELYPEYFPNNTETIIDTWAWAGDLYTSTEIGAIDPWFGVGVALMSSYSYAAENYWIPEIERIADDPPDEDYLSVYIPDIPQFPLPNLGDVAAQEAFSLFFDSFGEHYAAIRGLNITFDRYSAAYADGNELGASLQLLATLFYLEQLDSTGRAHAAAIDSVADLFDTANLDALAAELAYQTLMESLAQDGLPDETTSMLTSLGLSFSQQDEYLAYVLGLPTPDFQRIGYSDGLRRLANGVRAYTTEGTTDSDSDGVPDDQDICPGGDDSADADGDIVPDYCDPCPFDPSNDADGDGVCGDVDICPLGDDSLDADLDGMPDACDVCSNDPNNDADGDGVCGNIDNCPLDSNSNQMDTDDDLVGDACDPDDDGDGVCDSATSGFGCSAGPDNCPLLFNPTQVDWDGDGIGDLCDSDSDNDGIIDVADSCPLTLSGETVNADGCSVSDLCPCDGVWKNHGAYVRCVAHTSEDFLAVELITEAEKDTIVSSAAQSACGAKK